MQFIIKKNEAGLESELVTQLALAISVLWESFIHNLFIAYVMMDSNPALSNIKRSVTQSIKDRYGELVSRNINFTPFAIAQDKVPALLDYKGWNITAKSASELSQKANNFLAAPYARKFTLDSENSELFDYIIALRNYLSHNSVGSRKIFVNSVNNITQKQNLPLKGNMRQIANYLKTSVQNNSARVEYIAQRLQEIAKIL